MGKIKQFFGLEKKSDLPIGSSGGLSTMLIQGNSLAGFALGLGSGLGGFERISYQTAMSIYRQTSAVATAVDMIAEEVEHIRPVLRLPDGTLSDSAPILDALSMPNDRETWQDLIGNLARHYLLTHDAFPYAGGVLNRPPVEIAAVPPQSVNAMQGADGWADSYTVCGETVGTGHYVRTFTPKIGERYYAGSMKELLHIKGFSSQTTNIQADSPLMAICLDIYQQMSGKVHNVSLLKNGARPTLLVQFKDSADTDEHESRKQRINEQMSGADNAGKIVTISSSDMEVKELGITNKDMDYSNLQQTSANSVWMRYKIPLPLVSTDASTYNNMKTATYQLYDWMVLPTFDKLVSGLARLLLPRYGLDPKTHALTYNQEQISALRGRMLEELSGRKALGIETTNELRSGLPNRGEIEGGDVLYQAANLVPVGVDISTNDNEFTAEERARVLAEREQ